jgi:hypothetical protein
MKILSVQPIIVGILLISLCGNFALYARLQYLQNYVNEINYWVKPNEFDLLKKEIDRLENEKYQIIPPNKFTN